MTSSLTIDHLNQAITDLSSTCYLLGVKVASVEYGDQDEDSGDRNVVIIFEDYEGREVEPLAFKEHDENNRRYREAIGYPESASNNPKSF